MRNVRLPIAVALGIVLVSVEARAQSPELSMREFASGQIKKGVRSIGFGGDGATWGNYGLVYRDAATALADVGVTDYTNGNLFTFTAVGATTPPLWHGLAIYLIALSQHAEDVRLSLSSPGLGPGPRAVIGGGADQAVFSQDRRAARARILGGRPALLRAVAVQRRHASSAIRPPAPFITRRNGVRPGGLASPGNRFPGSWWEPA